MLGGWNKLVRQWLATGITLMLIHYRNTDHRHNTRWGYDALIDTDFLRLSLEN